jgi:hypothetical protein
VGYASEAFACLFRWKRGAADSSDSSVRRDVVRPNQPRGPVGHAADAHVYGDRKLDENRFQGYQVPASITLVQIFLAVTGTTPSTANNLLGLHYAYTPSTCASSFHAFEGSDTPLYGASNLNFEGACTGLYDRFAQTVGTTVGASYTLKFSLSNSAAGSSGLRITATDAAAPAGVPEPASWTMMLLGFGGIGFAMRRSRRLEPATA